MCCYVPECLRFGVSCVGVRLPCTLAACSIRTRRWAPASFATASRRRLFLCRRHPRRTRPRGYGSNYARPRHFLCFVAQKPFMFEYNLKISKSKNMNKHNLYKKI